MKLSKRLALILVFLSLPALAADDLRIKWINIGARMTEAGEDMGCLESTRIAVSELRGGHRKITRRLSREISVDLALELGTSKRRQIEVTVYRNAGPWAGHRFPRVSEPRVSSVRENDSEDALLDSLLDFPLALYYQLSEDDDFERYDVRIEGLAAGALGEKFYECPHRLRP